MKEGYKKKVAKRARGNYNEVKQRKKDSEKEGMITIERGREREGERRGKVN